MSPSEAPAANTSGSSNTMQTLDTTEVAQALAPPSKPTTTTNNKVHMNISTTLHGNKDTTTTTTNAAGVTVKKLPAKWVREMKRASSTLGIGNKEGGSEDEDEDGRLNDFLAKFQEEVVAARNLKAAMDSCRSVKTREEYKERLREHMRMIRELFKTEGEDFVRAIEGRNPGLAQATRCDASTLDIARGIERLEQAMDMEDRRRVAGGLRTLAKVGGGGGGGGLEGMGIGKKKVVDQVGVTRNGDGVTMVVSHSEETLCLMQSDLQALKVELMKLQRSNNGIVKSAGGNNEVVIKEADGPRSLPLMAGAEGDTNTDASSFSTAHGPDKFQVSDGHGGHKNPHAPGYVHHLEQMKSRLEALQRKKPVVRSRGKSTNRKQLVRSATFSSLNLVGDENQKPSQVPQTLPPITPEQLQVHAQAYKAQKEKEAAENKASQGITQRSVLKDRNSFRNLSLSRSKTLTNPKTPPARRRPLASMRADSLPASPGSPASSESFSPMNHRSGIPKGPRSHAMSIDAPEDLLNRPQSQAAAVDMQRYSLKVAKRFTTSRPPVVSTGRERPMPVGRAMSELAPSSLATARSLGTAGDGSSAANENGVVSATEIREGNGNKEGDDVIINGPVGASMPLDQFDTRKELGSIVVEEKESDLWVRKGILWKRWRRRFASVVSHEFFGRVLCLFSYNSSGTVISTRSQMIVLKEAVVRPLRDPIEHSSGLRYGFVLQTSSKEYYLAAQDAVTRGAWLKELRRAAGRPSTAALRASQSLHERLSTVKDRSASNKLMGSSSRRLLGRRR